MLGNYFSIECITCSSKESRLVGGKSTLHESVLERRHRTLFFAMYGLNSIRSCNQFQLYFIDVVLIWNIVIKPGNLFSAVLSSYSYVALSQWAAKVVTPFYIALSFNGTFGMSFALLTSSHIMMRHLEGSFPWYPCMLQLMGFVIVLEALNTCSTADGNMKSTKPIYYSQDCFSGVLKAQLRLNGERSKRSGGQDTLRPYQHIQEYKWGFQMFKWKRMHFSQTPFNVVEWYWGACPGIRPVHVADCIPIFVTHLQHNYLRLQSRRINGDAIYTAAC